MLPGKNVITQAQADDPALGKVRPIVAADREFNARVVEVNVGLVKEYVRLSTAAPPTSAALHETPPTGGSL